MHVYHMHNTHQDLMYFLDQKEGYIYAKSARSDRDLKMSCEGQLQLV